ncbi:hypothetical protein RYA05_00350 [Pseudomonas syringae pv. actinidiae]|nr:hypothetical protein [Pseudomonas syringae pv. actinidiae]
MKNPAMLESELTLRKLHLIYPLMSGVDEKWLAEYTEALYRYKCLSELIHFKTPSSIKALCESPERVRDLALDIYPKRRAKIMKAYSAYGAGTYKFSFSEVDRMKAIEAFNHLLPPVAALVTNYSDIDDADIALMSDEFPGVKTHRRLVGAAVVCGVVSLTAFGLAANALLAG